MSTATIQRDPKPGYWQQSWYQNTTKVLYAPPGSMVAHGTVCECFGPQSDAEHAARIISQVPELLDVCRRIVARARLVPCKNGGQDATEEEVAAGVAMGAGKWRVESSIDGWIHNLRTVLSKIDGDCDD